MHATVEAPDTTIVVTPDAERPARHAHHDYAIGRARDILTPALILLEHNITDARGWVMEPLRATLIVTADTLRCEPLGGPENPTPGTDRALRAAASACEAARLMAERDTTPADWRAMHDVVRDVALLLDDLRGTG